MKTGSLNRATGRSLLAAALFALGGCTAPGEPASTVMTAEQPASDAERLALALAEAEQAFENDDRPQLAAALRRIDALGASPAEEDTARFAEWRAAADLGPPMRGPALGPGYRSGRLPPGESYLLEQVFLSGKRASIALSAPGNARLTLQVQDRRDQPVCANERNPNHCQWVPIFTERYRIRIVNPGTAPAQYFLVIE